MASIPNIETRSPLTILNKLPKEHEKAIKQAFYNTAANLFVLFACAAAIAVYFILEAFLKPLLWAVLCGAFLYPFKNTLTKSLRNWLTNLHKAETPFVVGVILTPLKYADSAIDLVCNAMFSRLKLMLCICISVPAVYLLWHFGPLWGMFYVVKGMLVFLYDLLEYFGSFWIWTLFAAYLVAIVFFWSSETKVTLQYMSIPVWIIIILHVAATAGILRVPLFLLMGVGIVVGLVAETNEARKQQEQAPESHRKSVFGSALKVLLGETHSQPQPHVREGMEGETESVTSDRKTPPGENTGANTPLAKIQPGTDKFKQDVTKPSSLDFRPVDVIRRPKPKHSNLVSPTESKKSARSLSDQCFIGLLWALVLTRLWMHIWLISILLPVPVGLWMIKKLSIKLGSPEGPLGVRVQHMRCRLVDWLQDRKDVIMPKWLRGVARLVLKGDQKIILLLESSLDKITSIVFILLLLICSLLFGVIFAVQVQQESMYLVKTTSNLLNNTLHPEMANWLPKNEDLQKALDSMVGNAYLYGRNYIAHKVRDLVNGPSTDSNSQIESQVLDMWDRLYESWLARLHSNGSEILSNPVENSTSTSLARKGPEFSFDITNLSSIWDVITHGDGFNFGDIITFVKENIGTFISVLESVWAVLKGNMNLVITVFTSTLSLVFGGGTALLNFILSSVIFLTTLFYLLASSGDQYKPIAWFSAMSPTTGGNTFGQAVQDAVGGVFMASLKMGAFYGLYTWLTHSLFGVNIVFIPSALAAVFGAVPFVGAYLAAIPAVLELWLVQDRFALAMCLLVIHFLPTYVVDTAIYSEIKGGHPYMTGLAIAGGMYWLGLEGAIFGPIILCCLIVLINVYGTMIRPESPGTFARSNSVY
ncbi:transmembrane protein 245-like isoform X3 [Dreissena polymorpha]|uniref:transmembrane protein 245-like isoform X3 n=1 Tax=Dreissena polymorpha TaxID=45954 RepID=UPI002263ECD5|nr:transmembrane protein 245-like isoform X3 [Dreissena polymorpha]